jgi:hypothetical protein
MLAVDSLCLSNPQILGLEKEQSSLSLDRQREDLWWRELGEKSALFPAKASTHLSVTRHRTQASVEGWRVIKLVGS